MAWRSPRQEPAASVAEQFGFDFANFLAAGVELARDLAEIPHPVVGETEPQPHHLALPLRQRVDAVLKGSVELVEWIHVTILNDAVLRGRHFFDVKIERLRTHLVPTPQREEGPVVEAL
jgi:hypothetical protein